MKSALFIDRDGTLIVEPPDQQIDSFEKLKFVPEVIGGLARICSRTNFELVMATNQDGLGTPSFPEAKFSGPQNLLLSILEGEGVMFSDLLIDSTLLSENKDTRKPGTAMFQKYIYGGYDLKNSFVIGDRISDLELAENLGAQAILYGGIVDQRAALCSNSWREISDFLLSQPRTAAKQRCSNETTINLSLTLDGSGRSTISTGLGFFDHMLTLLFKQASWNGKIEAAGDLEVDDHHTIEDVAIVLGQSLNCALGEKKGIERYGCCILPMDEAQATVAIDFAGRNGFCWQARFSRSNINGVSTEMFEHFFRSFSQEARCSLQINAFGSNDHHIAESIFKAVGRSICQAQARSKEGAQSTKGFI